MKKRTLCNICLFLLIIRITVTFLGAEQNAPVYKTTRFVTLTGQIYQKEEKSKYQILYLKNQSIYPKTKIIVHDEKFSKLSIGNIVDVKGMAETFEGPHNPGNFNEKFYYEKQGISFRVQAKKIKVRSDQTDRFRESLFQLRKRWNRFLLSSLGKRRGGVLSAMMLGEKSDIPEDLKELYQVSGAAHILAISGLHLSFLGMAIYHFLRKCGCSFFTAGITGILFLTCYVIMTGGSVSAVRAWIMFVIRIGADMTGRIYDMLTSLMVAAVLIVFARPLSIYDAGFLLSFGAILSITVFLPFLKTMIPVRSKTGQSLLAGISIHLFLFPILIYFFYEVPLYAVGINLIILPLMSLLLGTGFAASIVGMFAKRAGSLMLKSCHLIFFIYEWLCRLALNLPFSRIITGRPKIYQVVFYYVALLLLIIFIPKLKKEKQRTRMILIYLVVLLSTLPFQGGKGHVMAAVLDVGQGDGIFIQGPEGTSYFIDGGSTTVKNVGKYRIEPFLKSKGISHLDYVLISHGDRDHFNGIEEMLLRQKQGIRIDTLVMTVRKTWNPGLKHLVHTALTCGTKVKIIHQGDVLNEGRMILRCLLPVEEDGIEPGNESSMVLLLSYKKFDMLLTGDVEGKGEEHLKEIPMKKVEVLKVAHHGSKNSTKEEILKKLDPKIGVISAGQNNPYGHPHKETIERLKKRGVRTFITKDSGCVMIVTDGNKIQIKK